MLKKIKRLRKQKKLTQIELSNILNVASTSIGNWESKRTAMPAEIVPRLCQVLETTPNELFGWEEEIYSKSEVLNLIQSLKDYTLESRNILGHDEREPEEFFKIWKLKQITIPKSGIRQIQL